MAIIKESPCFKCARLMKYPFCEAFPEGEGIPQEIRDGLNNHQESIHGEVTFLKEKTYSDSVKAAVEKWRKTQ